MNELAAFEVKFGGRKVAIVWHRSAAEAIELVGAHSFITSAQLETASAGPGRIPFAVECRADGYPSNPTVLEWM